MKNRKFELPLPVDEKGKPSITLLCAWTSFFVTEILTFRVLEDVKSELGKLSVLGIAFFTMVFFTLMMRMRRIDNFKINTKEGTLEVDSDEDDDKPREVSSEQVTPAP